MSCDRTHRIYVQIIATGGFFASCVTCGPDPFPNRRTLADAESDARAHGELHHIYSAKRLRSHEPVGGPV